MTISTRCPWCGALVLEDEKECSHCKTKFQWIAVKIPVNESLEAEDKVVVRPEIKVAY